MLAHVQTRPAAATEPTALALIDAMVAELHVLVPGRRAELAPSATPDEMSPPGGGYLVVYDQGAPMAGGGVRRLAAGIGEVKRMYVTPPARGRGLSRLLLAAIEEHARTLGYDRLRLDTGLQPAARHLYVTSGFVEIPDYNGNPYAAFWGEKIL